jgi:hypothetical protein
MIGKGTVRGRWFPHGFSLPNEINQDNFHEQRAMFLANNARLEERHGADIPKHQ